KVQQQIEHLRPQVAAIEAGTPGTTATYTTGSPSFHANPTIPFNSPKTAIATNPLSKPTVSLQGSLSNVLQAAQSGIQQITSTLLPQLAVVRQTLWQKGVFWWHHATGTWTPRFL